MFINLPYSMLFKICVIILFFGKTILDKPLILWKHILLLLMISILLDFYAYTQFTEKGKR